MLIEVNYEVPTITMMAMGYWLEFETTGFLAKFFAGDVSTEAIRDALQAAQGSGCRLSAALANALMKVSDSNRLRVLKKFREIIVKYEQ